MLDHWNFKDVAANSSLQQINRQKSARNLELLEFDPSEPCAVFRDVKRAERHTASLTECDCSDFNMSGSSPRRVFKPCMHIYRLATELGLIEPKYLDHDARAVVASARATALARQESQRLQRLPLDPNQWGGWSSEIHSSGIQKNRQYRAYGINHLEPSAVRAVCAAGDGWIIHGYDVYLSLCSCMDFRDRKLPCKHIYAAALLAGVALPVTFAEFESAQKSGLDMIFDFRSLPVMDPSVPASPGNPAAPPSQPS